MIRIARITSGALIIFIILALAGCAKKPKVDPVTEEMKAAVAGSAARPYVSGRAEWGIDPDREGYWVVVKMKNLGGDGQVALRAAIRTMTPYVGIGDSPTDPIYFDMAADEEVLKRLTGTISPRASERAISSAIEYYPTSEVDSE